MTMTETDQTRLVTWRGPKPARVGGQMIALDERVDVDILREAWGDRIVIMHLVSGQLRLVVPHRPTKMPSPPPLAAREAAAWLAGTDYQAPTLNREQPPAELTLEPPVADGGEPDDPEPDLPPAAELEQLLEDPAPEEGDVEDEYTELSEPAKAPAAPRRPQNRRPRGKR